MKKFENQYLLAKKTAGAKNKYDWDEIELTDYRLTHCPKLKAYEHVEEGIHIVLLGFCFHALNPDWREEHIVSNMPLEKSELLDYLDYLCGKYIILVEINGKLTLYNDPAATLKIFYFTENDIVIGVGPDPAILKENFSLEKFNDEKVLEFYNSDSFKKNLIRLGNNSIYKNTLQLLPNHALSINDNSVTRYFPREKKEDVKLDYAIDRVHQYLNNIMKAASSKFQLKCTVTSGWDSRILLMITKDYHESIEYLTFINPPYKQSHPDLKISKNISDKLRLNYKQYERPIMLNEKELKLAKDSFIWLGNRNIKDLLGGFSIFNNSNQLLLIGSTSEICKNYFDDVKISDGRSFTQAAHFPVLDYTVKHFSELYNELKKLELDYGYDLRDIGHWEQDITNFAAMGMLYRSLTTNTFSPFKCSIVLKTILSTPREYRDKQQHVFYKSYIDKYYPELNEFSVNPSFKNNLIVFAKKIGIYKGYKILSTKLRK